jgi:hypothetical protein
MKIPYELKRPQDARQNQNNAKSNWRYASAEQLNFTASWVRNFDKHM